MPKPNDAFALKFTKIKHACIHDWGSTQIVLFAVFSALFIATSHAAAHVGRTSLNDIAVDVRGICSIKSTTFMAFCEITGNKRNCLIAVWTETTCVLTWQPEQHSAGRPGYHWWHSTKHQHYRVMCCTTIKIILLFKLKLGDENVYLLVLLLQEKCFAVKTNHFRVIRLETIVTKSKNLNVLIKALTRRESHWSLDENPPGEDGNCSKSCLHPDLNH